MSQIHRELIARGLTTLPIPKRPSKPIAISTLHRLLSNPYYKGDVRFKGATYKGSHEAIVPKEVWYQVQAVLDAHKSAADATQVHDHYLKGTVYCGQCGERLIITNAKNRHGNVYPYFRMLWQALWEDRVHKAGDAHRRCRAAHREVLRND